MLEVQILRDGCCQPKPVEELAYAAFLRDKHVRCNENKLNVNGPNSAFTSNKTAIKQYTVVYVIFTLCKMLYPGYFMIMVFK